MPSYKTEIFGDEIIKVSSKKEVAKRIKAYCHAVSLMDIDQIVKEQIIEEVFQ